VGDEFGAVEALWSRFEGVMGREGEGDEGRDERGQGDGEGKNGGEGRKDGGEGGEDDEGGV